MISSLKTAFRLGQAPRLAFVGSGGKTTAMFLLAREYHTPVLVTSTSHLELSQLPFADAYYHCLTPQDVLLRRNDFRKGVTLLTGARNQHATYGLDDATLISVLALVNERQIPLLIEADGSRRHPLKAPAEHEPPIPEFMDTVVVTMGMSAIGQPFSAEWVHRPEIFSVLSGLKSGDRISLEAIRRVLCNPMGGLKNIPPGARRIALLNQVNSVYLQSQARILAPMLLDTFHAIVATNLQASTVSRGDAHTMTKSKTTPGIHAVYERVAGVILAAGESKRMGQAKLLLPWQGEPIVRYVAHTALDSGVSPVIVVLGAHADEIKAALQGIPVQFIYNLDWEAGQSTSVRAGILALPSESQAAIFLLGDQPQIPTALVRSLIDEYARIKASIVAPSIQGKRGNPVLFDRVLFPELLELKGDAGGRLVFARHEIHYIPWDDSLMLLDIDTPEDYRKLVGDHER